MKTIFLLCLLASLTNSSAFLTLVANGFSTNTCTFAFTKTTYKDANESQMHAGNFSIYLHHEFTYRAF